jgi:hypothetical protein
VTPTELLATYPTLDDLLEHVRALGKLTGADNSDAAACTVGELLAQAIGYQDAAQGAEPTWFAQFLIVLGYIQAVASPIASVAGAFTAAAGVVPAAKAL